MKSDGEAHKIAFERCQKRITTEAFRMFQNTLTIVIKPFDIQGENIILHNFAWKLI